MRKIIIVLGLLITSISNISAQEIQNVNNNSNNAVNENTDYVDQSTNDARVTKEEKGENLVITENNQHALGSKIPKGRAEIELITEKSKGKPRKDFIDVSSHNGEITVNEYNIFKKYGVKGVVVKLTEHTTYRNPYAKSQINNAKKAGLKVSAYHFSHFNSKSSAETEAKYFLSYAKELGLSSSTVMVNDFECNCSNEYNANASKNSKYFANYLKNKGYKNVLHYSYSGNIGENKVLKPSVIGNNTLWIAGYPYTPSSSDLWFTNAEAWQWTSNLKISGIDGRFDANIDYTGRFTGVKNQVINENLKKVKENNYATVTSANAIIYNDLKTMEVKGKSTSYNYKTLKNTGYYLLKDGKKYYSLRDKNDKWVGYIEGKYLKFASLDKGYTFKSNQYATISVKDWRIWNNISPFKTVNYKTENLFGRTYKIKNINYHFNGNTYVDLYDNQNHRLGQVNIKAVRTADNAYGRKTAQSNYAAINQKGITIYDDLVTQHKKTTTDKYYLKTLHNSGYYRAFNGKIYYSLRDQDDNWVGYIERSSAITITNDEKGVARDNKDMKYGTVSKKNWRIWNSISPFKTVTYKSEDLYDRTYKIGSKYYNHVNGDKYVELFDNKGKRLGFANAGMLRFSDNAYGRKTAQSNYAAINQKGVTIYDDLVTQHKKTTTDKYYLKTLHNSGYYRAFNGKIYYSLRDKDDNWVGYIERSSAITITNDEKGVARDNRDMQYATIAKKNWRVWDSISPFKDVVEKTENIYGKTYKVGSKYYNHVNGDTYVELFSKDGKRLGFINTGALNIK